MAGAAASFFELQENARRGTRWLFAAFALATLFVIACFSVLVAPPFLFFSGEVPRGVLYGVALAVGTAIAAVSAHRWWRLREGGEAIAEWLGARRIAPGGATPSERRLLNVVEEMAIASGVAVPPVYCLDGEPGINALAAGYSANEAVLVVTEAAIARLRREELQGMIAHEFSHILNGDMALNARMAAVSAGLMCFSSFGERLVFAAARHGAPLAALAGALMAFIGFPGALAADALRAAIAREREFLADAASVQFTRDPEAIAGALDAVQALRTHTFVHAAHAPELAHMFFAPVVAHWWFATHPPIAERIRRVHPEFAREDYRHRRRRLDRPPEVAVLDDSGNVVKVLNAAALGAQVGKPAPAHLARAASLLARLPASVSQRLASAEGAAGLVLALARDADAAGVARAQRFPVVELALPVLKARPQVERDRLIAEIERAVESDGRVRLSEFVLLTFVRQHLRAGAGRALPAHYRSVREAAEPARVVLSLLAHAGAGAAAYARARAALELGEGAPLPLGELGYRRVGEALEVLRALAPLAKPRLLKACIDCAAADGSVDLAEAELLRTVAATLDCPLPAVLG